MQNEGNRFWKTCVSVNANTDELYIKPDVTYTVLHVPQQENAKLTKAYHFQITFGEKHSIAIPMHQCTSTLFSAQSLTHSQIYIEPTKTPSEKHSDMFINFEAY